MCDKMMHSAQACYTPMLYTYMYMYVTCMHARTCVSVPAPSVVSSHPLRVAQSSVAGIICAFLLLAIPAYAAAPRSVNGADIQGKQEPLHSTNQ